MKNLVLVFFMVLALCLIINAETIRTDYSFTGGMVKQDKACAVRAFNASGAPLITGQPVKLILDTSVMVIDDLSTDGPASNYLVFGITQSACDTGDYVTVVTGSMCNISFAASQSDTTTDGGLLISLSATEGYCQADAADTDFTATYSTPARAPIGYTLEEIGSNAATTGIKCFLYRRF